METNEVQNERKKEVDIAVVANDGALVDDDGKPKRTGL